MSSKTKLYKIFTHHILNFISTMYSYRAAVDFVDDMEECMREPTQHIGVFHNQTLTGIRLILNT